MKIYMEDEKDFIKYYSLLDLSEKKDLLLEIINIKNTNTSLDLIEKIDCLYNNLMMKCSAKTLTNEENDLFLGLSARYIINNIQVDDDILDIYVNNYLLKKSQYKSEEIIIYLNYFRCFFNRFFNKEVRFDFQNRFHIDYEFGIPLDNNIKNMKVNVCPFRKILDRSLTLNSYYSHMVYISFIILHEYVHLLQDDYISRNCDNNITKNYIIESMLMKNDKKFYDIYHDYFDTEQEADNFAFTYTEYFLKSIIPIDIVRHYLEEIKYYNKIFDIEKKKKFEIEKAKRKEYYLS